MSTDAIAGVLVVMAKRPGAAAKTRLSPLLDVSERKALAEAFLRDKAAQLNALGRTFAIAVAPPEAPTEMRDLVGATPELFAQVGAEFGERLHSAMAKKFADGCPWVALVDGDTPTLPTGYLREACEALDAGVELVVGPAWDGGYYFIGFSRTAPFADFFANMLWSTCTVFSTTIARADAAQITTHVLPAWYDVDTPHDLARLADELRYASLRNPGFPVETANFLAQLARANAAKVATP